MKDNITFHLLVSKSLYVITSSKIASRFLEKVFDLNDGRYYNIITDCELNIVPDFNDIYGTDEWNDVESIWESIKSGNCQKQVLIIYRNPFNRVLTGLVQNFYSDLYTPNFGFDFKLKHLLQDYNNSGSIYTKITSSESTILDIIHLFSSNELIVLKKIFLKYCLEYPSDHLMNDGHVAPYISFLYSNFKKFDLSSNYSFLDLDDKNRSLKNFLTNFFPYTEEWEFAINTNSVFTDDIKNIDTEGNSILYNDFDKKQIQIIREKLFLSTKVERFFYEKMKEFNNKDFKKLV